MEALLEMLGYAKFLMELITKKRSLDFETSKVSYDCSVIMTNELIKKREDPGNSRSIVPSAYFNLLKSYVNWEQVST